MSTLTQSFLQGEIVEEKYTLMRYLGGSDHSAVFQTQYGGVHPRDAAIKLLPAPPGNAEARLSGWRLAANISHPHLMRIIDMGRCELANAPMLFVVTELASENLGEILPQRPLTTAEAQDMLASLLDALVFLHNRGFVHGRIKPSNIMAVGDDLKLSADTICRLGEPVESFGAPSVYDAPEGNRSGASSHADIWSVGVTLVETLTQQKLERESSGRHDPVLPETMPQGFAEIARHCLRRAPNKRWTASTVQLHLPKATSKPVSSRAAEGIAQATPRVRETIDRAAREIPRLGHALAQFGSKVAPKLREAGRAMAPIATAITLKILKTGVAMVHAARDVRLPEIRLPHARRYVTGAAVLGVAAVAIAAGVKFAGHGGASAAARSHNAPALVAAKHVRPARTEKRVSDQSRSREAARIERSPAPERVSAAPTRIERLRAPEQQAAAPERSPAVAERLKPSVNAPAAAPVPVTPAPTAPPSNSGASAAVSNGSVAGRVLQRVLPDVPRSASHTIWGTVRVAVRVAVDSAGNVTQAELQSAGPSRYFARLSVEAARKWHFAAPTQNGAPVASVWLLHFGYRHDGTGVEPSELQP